MNRTRRPRLSRRAGALFAATVFLAAASCKAPAPAAPRPSVLLVTLDTTRADRLGCYGSAAGLTPFLDEFAGKSTLFSRCESAVPLTLPSHVSILSGALPLRHGVRVNVEMGVPPALPLLADEFSRAGYRTGAFISASVLLKRYGLDRGFETYDDSFYDTLKKGHQKAPAEHTLSRALEWIRHQAGPWFCWVHLFDPHVPYAAPEPFGTRYKDRPYDGEIAYMDAQLRSFWEALSARPGSGDLVVVICADHGEGLGDHGEMDHGVFIYQSTMHVPLLIRTPGQAAGGRVDALVGLVDVAPTVWELAGLPAPAVDGRSLAPLLRGGSLPERPLLLESMDGLLTYGWAPLYGVAGGREKYILAPKAELYDLAADPAERDNLVSACPARALALRGEILAAQRTIRTAAPVVPKVGATPEELRQLASLGYIGGTFSPTAASNRDPKDLIDLQKPILDANLLLSEGKPRDALPLLARISARDPKNPFVLFLTGQAYSGSDPARAIAAWKEAVRCDPSYHMAWTEWVVMLLNQGKVEEAARVAGAGLASCRDRLGVLHVALAEKAFLDGAPEAAVLGPLSEALELNPDLARAYLLRAQVHLRAGDQAAAEADLQAVWQHASVPEVNRWERDPAFRTVFAARPKK